MGWRVRAAVLVAVLSATLGASAQTPQQIAQTAFSSTVTVLVYDAAGQPLGLGSGFVVSPGQVVTNAHVVAGASRILVRLIGSAGTSVVTALLQMDDDADLVLLQVEDLTAAALPLATGDVPSVGDTVYAVGSPLGLDGTFSQGIVSGYRTVGDISLVQITAPISPGSSGGPVLDRAGRVIGVAVGTFTAGQNLNFAVPVTVLSEFLARPADPRSVATAASVLRDATDAGLGTDLTGAVEGGALRFDSFGAYSFSVRNLLPRPVQDVQVIVVFYDEDGFAVDTDAVRVLGPILPGLGERVTSRVDTSVQEIVTGSPVGPAVRTRVEIRVLAFAFAD